MTGSPKNEAAAGERRATRMKTSGSSA